LRCSGRIRTLDVPPFEVPALSVGVRIGLCGFTMSMEDYALYFPVVEIQNTFYEPPRDTLLRKWRAVTAPSLEFTMKVWQLVTHAAGSPTYRRMKNALPAGAEPGFFRDSAAVENGWRRSLECARLLNATAVLFQCPASFTPDAENVGRMRRFFERIERPQARLLWEPRGQAWVKNRTLALSLCRDLDLLHVVDPFVTEPEPAHPVYWRLHGISGPRHSYADAELRRLRDLLRRVRSDAPAYVMFNNLPRVGDAKRFARLLAQDADDG
jgi:uncharacterized protein YecE (DUF72 family)